jgi:hypothetical protein
MRLSQGRAVGVHVIAALQDPCGDVLPFRDLFPTRIALRMTGPEQADMVLGDGEAGIRVVALPAVARKALAEHWKQHANHGGEALVDTGCRQAFISMTFGTPATTSRRRAAPAPGELMHRWVTPACGPP